MDTGLAPSLWLRPRLLAMAALVAACHRTPVPASAPRSAAPTPRSARTIAAVPSASHAPFRATQLALGREFGCALGADGRVACWGNNEVGQLGRGLVAAAGEPPADHPAAVIGLVDAVQVALGARHACARLRDATVRCWGGNDEGQLGDGSRQDRASPVAVRGLADVAELALGRGHSCARLRDGAVRCWGANDEGQLGDGSREPRTSPVAVQRLEGVATLRAGGAHSCARMGDATVHCWGNNSNGQLGDGTYDDRPVPVAVSALAHAAEIDLGDDHSCARLDDGGVRCWGDRERGQVGDGRVDQPRTQGERNGYEPGTLRGVARAVPRVRGVRDAAAIALGAMTSCVRTAEGRIWCWGAMDFATGAVPGRSAGRDQRVPTLVQGMTEVQQFVVSRFDDPDRSDAIHACALRVDGSVLCMGRSPDPTRVYGRDVSRPTALAALGDAVDVALGASHACALMRDGTVRCWGQNAQGQLGDGTVDARTHPTPIAGLQGVAALALAGYYSCARLRDGTVRCWGQNPRRGPDGATTWADAPAAVAGVTGAHALALGAASPGEESACALRGAGPLACWRPHGAEVSGLGFGFAARPIAGVGDLAEVALGGSFACARSSAQRVVCWGENQSNQLGAFTESTRVGAPIEVAAVAGATQIATGDTHACALRADGTVLCWGANFAGQLGDGTRQEGGRPARAAPAAVPGLGAIAQLALGGQHSCARGVDGRVWCWGANASGEIGDGTREPRPSPTRVAGLPGPATRVVAGATSTCALFANGPPYCWGSAYGVLTDDATVPDGMIRIAFDPARL